MYYPGINVISVSLCKCRISLDGFMLSCASTSLQITHWGFCPCLSSMNEKPHFKYFGLYLRFAILPPNIITNLKRRVTGKRMVVTMATRMLRASDVCLSLSLFFQDKRRVQNQMSINYFSFFKNLFIFYKLSVTRPDRVRDPLLGRDPPVENH